MRRIVYVNPGGGLGGAERCLLDLFATLPSRAPELELCLIALSPGPFVDKARELGVRCTLLPLPPVLETVGDSQLSLMGSAPALARALFAARAFSQRLKDEISALRPHLVHSNGIKSHLLLSRVSAEFDVVWHVHDFLGRRPLAGRLLRRAARDITGIVTNSRAVHDDIEQCLPFVPRRWILNGVDTGEFSPATGDGAWLDVLSGLPPAAPTTPRIGLIATYARWKGQIDFLKAVQLLAEGGQTPTGRFYIIGGPVYRTHGSQFSESELRREIGRLGLSDRVGLIPFQENLAPIYHALDIVVHASSAPEPFGRVIAEAMACEKAVIVSAAGGASEVITDGTDALGFAPGDIQGLSAAIARLLLDQELRQALGKAARVTAVSRFSRDRYANEWIEYYRALNQHGRATTRAPGASADTSGPALVVAMGYVEDGWHSSRIVATGLLSGLSEGPNSAFSSPVFFAPRCHRKPRWVDRRFRFGLQVPSGRILQLMDHSYGDALLAARNRFECLSVIIHDVAFWRTRTAINSTFRKRILKGLEIADCRIAGSKRVAAEIEAELSLKVDHIIPYGLMLDQFPHSASPRDPRQLLTVGTTDWRKGIDRALRLLSALPSDYRLLHVGSPFTKEQHSIAQGLGISGRVHDLGYLPPRELTALYQTSGALLFPSRYEGFGLPVIEARLCGTRVIAQCDVPALEYLQHDEGTQAADFAAFDGVPGGAASPIIDAVLKLPTTSCELSQREFFGWKRAARQYCEIYESILAS